jgi:hypothetical protein
MFMGSMGVTPFLLKKAVGLFQQRGLQPAARVLRTHLQAEKYFFTGGPGKKMIRLVSRRARRELCEAFSPSSLLGFHG